MEYYKHLFGQYYVSENSNIYDCIAERLLTETLNEGGYLVVWLKVDGKRKQYKHHRAVSMAWIPNPDNLGYVNHINGIKHDNAITNLEWCTHKQNMLHALKTGLFSGRTRVNKETIADKRKARQTYNSLDKKLKNIKLSIHVLKRLSKQAEAKGFNNLQNYLEDVLIKQSDKY